MGSRSQLGISFSPQLDAQAGVDSVHTRGRAWNLGSGGRGAAGDERVPMAAAGRRRRRQGWRSLRRANIARSMLPASTGAS